MRQIKSSLTFQLLLEQHNGQVLVPLSVICQDYLGVCYRVARRHYLEGKLRIPVIAMGHGQKAPLMVHIEDLAMYVDGERR
ncbi:pyocin activator PrtN family protein [Vibrio scophthalmi]|uniref:pyocin activator PrtN family protein n=1 Tax=Vibrio scophthalmi TaxID=45658 RepID=UPI003AAA3B75